MPPVLSRLALALGRNDEEPNIALAKNIAAKGDRAAVRELVAGLSGKADVASDCIKVLYEIGALKPALIQDYVPYFVKLLSSKNNRLVWGSHDRTGQRCAAGCRRYCQARGRFWFTPPKRAQ